MYIHLTLKGHIVNNSKFREKYGSWAVVSGATNGIGRAFVEELILLKFNIVIIGRSNLVGKPLFGLLSQKFQIGNATVTLCHSRTKNIEFFTKEADIIIAAVGVPKLVKSNMIKDNCILIDVGINRIDDDSKKGYHIVGDIDFDSVQKKASAVTPVPGGVGVMTVTMLLYNTVNSIKV